MDDIAYLALGSNQGDRMHFLREAVLQLAAHPHIHLLRQSRIYQTESIEGGGDGDFLNAAICIQTSLTPLELLSVTQEIEAQLGRPSPPRHGPRCIDIDILFFERQQINTAELRLPHPRMHRRPFVLAPLLDVLKNGDIQLSSLTW